MSDNLFYYVIIFSPFILIAFTVGEYLALFRIRTMHPEIYEEYLTIPKIIGPFTLGAIVRNLLIVVSFLILPFLCMFFQFIFNNFNNTIYIWIHLPLSLVVSFHIEGIIDKRSIDDY